MVILAIRYVVGVLPKIKMGHNVPYSMLVMEFLIRL